MSEDRMTDAGRHKLEAGTSIYHCPVDGCGWTHIVPPLDPRINGNTLAGAFGPGVMAQVAANQRAEKIERALRDHLKSHDVLDYVRTIQRLKDIERQPDRRQK